MDVTDKAKLWRSCGMDAIKQSCLKTTSGTEHRKLAAGLTKQHKVDQFSAIKVRSILIH